MIFPTAAPTASILLGDARVALVLAAQRAAVGEEVLGRREDRRPVGRGFEAADGGRAQRGDQRAFEMLKVALMSAPILAMSQDVEMFVLDVDASDLAVGAVLQQVQGEALWVIGYAS